MSESSEKEPIARRYPVKHLIAVAMLSLVVVVVLTILPTPDATATRTVQLESPLQQATGKGKTVDKALESADRAVAKADPASNPEDDTQNQEASTASWMTEDVESGDTLSHIFKRAGLSPRDLHNVMTAKGDTSTLKRIHPGQQLKFSIQDENLNAMEYVISQTESLMVTRDGDNYVAKTITRELEPFTSYAEGTIDSSLFLAAQKAGLSTNVTMELANIFGWDIDFAQDIREGDSFKVIYQELRLKGEKVKDGEILAAQFTNQGKTYTAIRYETADHQVDYYSPDGYSLRKAFRRSPVDFARISSPFNLHRRHPILHTIRAHKGTDYAAPKGTPIKATGDGKVIFAGWAGGYGRVIKIKHSHHIETVYGHMNGFARHIHAGVHVVQGQVIGYVGMTGLATGPHCHYEFHVNGQVRNPQTVKLPQANPISTRDKPAFLALAAQMENQIATYSAAMQSEHLARTE